MRQLVINIIHAYQFFISPLKAPCCRFYPSCSAYAKEAITKNGLCRGGMQALLRICRCHPFHPGGHDPVI